MAVHTTITVNHTVKTILQLKVNKSDNLTEEVITQEKFQHHEQLPVFHVKEKWKSYKK